MHAKQTVQTTDETPNYDRSLVSPHRIATAHQTRFRGAGGGFNGGNGGSC